jgi:regulator of protease activity HflC (stomatin/prohibitin superfamily)
MNEALAWIGQIAEWFGKFIPRWELLDVTHQAVKIVRGGKRIVVCKPGQVHYWWPVTTLWFAHPVARQTVNLPSQTITLSDGKSVAIGGLVVIEVKDIEQLLCKTFDPDDAIRDISLTSIHDTCCQLDWPALMEQQRTGELDRKLKSEAKKELDRYGVKVIKMSLTDLAPCRVLKLMQDGGK